MKFGVIVFPGSNCDHDAYHVISKHVGQPVDFIWHRDTDLSSYDAVIMPGALIRNRDLHFVCDYVNVRVENIDTPFTHELKPGSVLQMPIAHAEGNFVCDDATFDELQTEGRIIFRYCDRNGEL